MSLSSANAKRIPDLRISSAIIRKPSLNTHLESFVQAMHPDGGWGYGVGQPPREA